MIVGLTGGIGSGKSTVAAMFSELGVPVYIADTEAKKLMHTSPKIREQIVQLFGEKAYTQSGPDNAYIAGIVFRDKTLLTRLNSIIHPEVGRHFKGWYTNQKAPYVIKEAAILFESGAYKDCDAVITVTAPLETRIERVILRDGAAREAVEARIKNQWDEARKIELSDYVITNTDLENTEKQVQELHLRLIKAREQ
ncbi:dephospho-CoA kinase [Sinomicrobium weinanense]|uniref:Dephospho-CoA kinase n=2 Tax=Sinomicrobium weinanense TaxID=2842200 RepID=A0A926JW23_9FLAO|nr:dephospho-CoA kinase [Sinomicrobium weinanense]MBC9798645.1 dephospho-CoA kinase [Sinomicrobium weinanense]MBU3122369.1 dephospho-CoA kinase [Sinomicrobium weinanense]